MIVLGPHYDWRARTHTPTYTQRERHLPSFAVSSASGHMVTRNTKGHCRSYILIHSNDRPRLYKTQCGIFSSRYYRVRDYFNTCPVWCCVLWMEQCTTRAANKSCRGWASAPMFMSNRKHVMVSWNLDSAGQPQRRPGVCRQGCTASLLGCTCTCTWRGQSRIFLVTTI
jgi:hypothetical protein